MLDRNNELLLVFNNHPSERSDLTLAYARDDGQLNSEAWQILFEFENENREPAAERIHNPYSYPFIIKTRDGDFHLFYTWKRRYIKHVYFNRTALEVMRNGGAAELTVNDRGSR